MRLTYGYQVVDGQDPFVNLIEKANDNFNAATVAGAYPVDFFPMLKKLPEWLPGMGFMQTAREWAKDTEAMVEVPWAYTKAQMVSVSVISVFRFMSINSIICHGVGCTVRPQGKHHHHSCRPTLRTKATCLLMRSEI